MGFVADTEILLYDGTNKKIQNIKKGEKIMGIDGKPKIITNIEKVHGCVYTINPVKGIPYTISNDHILSFKATKCYGIVECKKYNSYYVRWVENFKTKAKFFPVNNYVKKTHAHKAAVNFLAQIQKKETFTEYGDIIKVRANKFINLAKGMQRYYKTYSKGVNFEEEELDTDPYIFGYWLGDGNSNSTGITTAESEVVEYFENYSKENNLVFKKNGKSKYHYLFTSGKFTGSHGRNSFLNFLKKYDLLNNKHIPNIFKFNSRENRLKLLAGIIDSDGHYAGNGYDIVFKSEKLADDTVFLARSLGFKAFIKKCKKTCTNSSNGRVTGTYYRFIIYGDGLENIPSLLKRKQAHKRVQIKNASVSGVEITKLNKQSYYNLEVDCKRLFLKDFTVVHK